MDVVKISDLLVPFSIIYGQGPTTCKRNPCHNLVINSMHDWYSWFSQGAAMEPFLGFIEAPSIDICDCKQHACIHHVCIIVYHE